LVKLDAKFAANGLFAGLGKEFEEFFEGVAAGVAEEVDEGAEFAAFALDADDCQGLAGAGVGEDVVAVGILALVVYFLEVAGELVVVLALR